jgi:hypothetical protein
LWSLIRSTPALDWFLLTKRPQNIGDIAADRLGRGLAARLAWHYDREPRGSQSPHPASCRDPGGTQVPQRRAHVRAGRCRAVAAAAPS